MEEIKQVLIDLGLTEVQAKVLIALQGFDYADVKKISNVADIHRQQIYPVLAYLQNLGLIKKRLGNPNKYNSLTIDQIFSVLLDRKAQLMSDIKKRTMILQNEIKKTLSTKNKKEDFVFELITGKERVKMLVHECGKTARTMDVVLKFDPLFYYIIDEMETKKIEREEDLKLRIVTDADPKMTTNWEVPSKKSKIRFVDYPLPVELVIYNNNRAQFAMYSSRNNIPISHVAVLTSNHPCFVAMLQNYFDILWKESKELPRNQK